MRVINIGNHKIELYDSPESMPIKRYHRFNKFLMIDNEVGSDFGDFDRRSVKSIEFLKKGMYDDAIKELENRRQMVFNSFVEYSPKGMAFAILVHSIDGVVYSDYSGDGLKDIIDKVDKIELSQNEVVESVETVKKKWKKSLLLIFQKSLGVLKGLSITAN